MKGSELVLIYDIRQVPALVRFLEKRSSDAPEVVVAACDAEIVMRLQEQGIHFISARDYRAKDSTHFVQSEEGLAFLENSAWSWFTYRGIALGKLFFPILQGHIRQVIYYTDIMVRICNAHQGIKRIIVLAPTQDIPQAGAYSAKREIFVVADCAKMVGKQRGLEILVHESTPIQQRAVVRTQLFFLQRDLFSAGLAFLNFFTNRLRGKGRLRVLASDYWRNIAPVLARLPGAEVILLDRKQVLNVRLKNAWRYRMIFINPDRYAAPLLDAERQKEYDRLTAKWREARLSVPDTLHVGDVSAQPFLVELLDEVMLEWLPSILQKIDELYTLLDTLRPDIVLLRATVSQQWHFPLLALISKMRGIPSLELLHGMEYLGPGSLDKRHIAEYVGVYGSYTQRQMRRIGFTAEQTPVIGSPRFDLYELKQYAEVRKDRRSTPGRFSVFVTAPDIFIGGSFDTYDIEEYFSSVAAALQAVPGASALIKLRPGPARENFYRQAIAKAFSDIPHVVAQYEPLRTLFPDVDLAVSCQSTVTLEALQCGVPLVLFAATPVETLMLKSNFTDVAEEDAVALCLDASELSVTLSDLAAHGEKRQKMSAAAQTFLNREFAFDGRAAERAAAFIRGVTGKKGVGTSATVTTL